MHTEHLVAKYGTADNVKERESCQTKIKNEKKKKQQQFTVAKCKSTNKINGEKKQKYTVRKWN